MSIRHIVLLPLKPTLSQKEIDHLMQSFSDLKKIIPQMISFSGGENNSPENLHQGYLHGFVMEFNTDLDRKIYLEHPEHLRLVQELIIPSIVNGVLLIVFDYVI